MNKCLNRTFMELKSLKQIEVTQNNISLNRTFMELKFSKKMDFRNSENV